MGKDKSRALKVGSIVLCAATFVGYAQGMMEEFSGRSAGSRTLGKYEHDSIKVTWRDIDDIIEASFIDDIENVLSPVITLGMNDDDISSLMELLEDQDRIDEFHDFLIEKGALEGNITPDFLCSLGEFYTSMEDVAFGIKKYVALGLMDVVIKFSRGWTAWPDIWKSLLGQSFLEKIGQFPSETRSKAFMGMVTATMASNGNINTLNDIFDRALMVSERFQLRAKADVFCSIMALMIKSGENMAILDQALEILDGLPANMEAHTFSDIFCGIMAFAIRFDGNMTVLDEVWKIAAEFPGEEVDILSGIMALTIRSKDAKNVFNQILGLAREIVNQFPDGAKACAFRCVMASAIRFEGDINILRDIWSTAFEMIDMISLFKDNIGGQKIVTERIMIGLMKRERISALWQIRKDGFYRLWKSDPRSAKGLLINTLLINEDIDMSVWGSFFEKKSPEFTISQ